MKNMKALITMLLMVIMMWSVTTYAGNVVKIVKEDEYLPGYEVTKYNAELQKFYYEGVVAGAGIIKPTDGEVGKFIIENIELTMKDGVFKSGAIDTKELGEVRVLFSSSLSSIGFIVLLSDEQLMKLGSLIEVNKKK